MSGMTNSSIFRFLSCRLINHTLLTKVNPIMSKIVSLFFFLILSVASPSAMEEPSASSQEIKTTFHIYHKETPYKCTPRDEFVTGMVLSATAGAIAMGCHYAQVGGWPVILLPTYLCARGLWDFSAAFINNYANQKPIETMNEKNKWQEAPYLDLAFRTTQGDQLLWEATVKLRPMSPGWCDKGQEDDRFTSCVKVQCFQGDSAENYVETVKRYSHVFGNDHFTQLSQISHNENFLMIYRAKISPFENEVPWGGLFKGTLKQPISLWDLYEALSKIISFRLGNEGGLCIPDCNWSGRNVSTSSFEEVLNPAIYSCRLLSNLGVPMEKTLLKRFLSSYTGNDPITRELIVKHLSQHKETLGISHS